MTLTLLCATRTSPRAAEKVKVKVAVNGRKTQLPYPLYQSNGTRAVELRAYENQFTGSDYYYRGIYRCAIETTAVNGHMGRASVYIGLYNATSGEMHAD